MCFAKTWISHRFIDVIESDPQAVRKPSNPPLSLLGLFAALVLFPGLVLGADAAAPWSADLNRIRQMATLIPGPRPLRVNVIKFAESRRTKNFAVKGSPAEPSVQARTAYQIVYAEGAVMVDTGMDLATHRFFGRGTEEPYFPEAAAHVAKALREARAIIVTHEHGDHVAGLIRSPSFNELAPKTVLTQIGRA